MSEAPTGSSASGSSGGFLGFGNDFWLPLLVAVVGALGASGALKVAGTKVPWVLLLVVFLAVLAVVFAAVRRGLWALQRRRERAYLELAGLAGRLPDNRNRWLDENQRAEVKQVLRPFICDEASSQEVSEQARALAASMTGTDQMRMRGDVVVAALRRLLATIERGGLKSAYRSGQA